MLGLSGRSVQPPRPMQRSRSGDSEAAPRLVSSRTRASSRDPATGRSQKRSREKALLDDQLDRATSLLRTSTVTPAAPATAYAPSNRTQVAVSTGATSPSRSAPPAASTSAAVPSGHRDVAGSSNAAEYATPALRSRRRASDHAPRPLCVTEDARASAARASGVAAGVVPAVGLAGLVITSVGWLPRPADAVTDRAFDSCRFNGERSSCLRLRRQARPARSGRASVTAEDRDRHIVEVPLRVKVDGSDHGMQSPARRRRRLTGHARPSADRLPRAEPTDPRAGHRPTLERPAATTQVAKSSPTHGADRTTLCRQAISAWRATPAGRPRAQARLERPARTRPCASPRIRATCSNPPRWHPELGMCVQGAAPTGTPDRMRVRSTRFLWKSPSAEECGN